MALWCTRAEKAPAHVWCNDRGEETIVTALFSWVSHAPSPLLSFACVQAERAAVL